MGIFSGVFDFLTDGVDEFLGLDAGSTSSVLGAVGKAGLSALNSKKQSSQPFPRIPSFNTQPQSTNIRSDAGEATFYKATDVQRLHQEWLERMARFASLEKIVDR